MACKVLVVEDDRDIRRNLQTLLQSEGYEVVLTENGKIALDYLSQNKEAPHLIILDLMMPVMDGFEFRKIQQGDPNLSKIPVIIMTADGHIQEKMKRTEAYASIRKPADIDTILKTVKQVC